MYRAGQLARPIPFGRGDAIVDLRYLLDAASAAQLPQR